MKLNNIKLLILFGFIGLSTAPGETAASTALQLSDTTLLYTINFSLGDESIDFGVPMQAKHGVAYNDRKVDVLGYTVASKEEPDVSIDLISAVVLANAPIKDSRYQVKAGSETNFTLLILATFNEPIPEGLYQARITKLPYWFNGRRTTTHQNQLDDLSRPTVEVR